MHHLVVLSPLPLPCHFGTLAQNRGLVCAYSDGYSFVLSTLHKHMLASGPHSDFSRPTSGCTACVAIIRNNQLIVANADDSHCVISRKGQVTWSLSRISFCLLKSKL
ncbi:probable protein phosphatase 2C 20 [Camellia sinensis]|uniref:probable protein phosphatase 2C 20 n=1 Tax=Camellia sinensis TaxID=4442 RepID=UPI0010361609|nr:probable protein phosphatase 2C 20 [Camellia sinensis]